MKKLIVGLIAGLILGIIGTALLYRPRAERAGREETPESSPQQSAIRAIKQPEGTLSEPLESGDRLPVRRVTGEAAFREASPSAAGQEESLATLTGEEAETQPAIESGTIEELLNRWPDIYLSGNASRIYALLDELKAEGMKDIDRMITIFRGSDSLTNRLTAAQTLGAMNRDLQVLVSTTPGDAELKSTARSALGSFGGNEAAKECVNLLRYGDDTESRIRAGQVLAMMNNRRLESAPGELIRDEVIPLLKETWSEEASDDMRREIVNGLGIAGGPEEIEFLNNISTDDRDLSRSIRRAIRRIEYREENGEDMVVSRMNRMRR